MRLHRWLQDLADDEIGWEHDITDPTASWRRTDEVVQLINGYNIDEHTARRLTHGTIIQRDGQEVYESVFRWGEACNVAIS